MGISASSKVCGRNRANSGVQLQCVQQQQQQQQQRRILMLGAGQGGKSTFLKQLTLQMGIVEKELYSTQIKENIIEGLYQLLAIHDKIDGLEPMINSIGQTVDTVKDRLLTMRQGTITIEDLNEIEYIWKDSLVQKLWKEYRNQGQVLEMLDYYLNQRFEDIKLDIYRPTSKDIAFSQRRTLGRVVEDCRVEEHEFLLIDVGGQRSERSKWASVYHPYPSVILFVVDASAYNRSLFEDSKTNSLKEDLEVFTDIVNCKQLRRIPIVLALNKIDLFDKKIHEFPLEDYIPEYTGGYDRSEAMNYIQNAFQDIYDNQQGSTKSKFMIIETNFGSWDSCVDTVEVLMKTINDIRKHSQKLRKSKDHKNDQKR